MILDEAHICSFCGQQTQFNTFIKQLFYILYNFVYYALAYRNYTYINVYFLTICVWNSSKKLKSYMNPDLYILFVIKPCLLLSNCLFSYSRKQNLPYITFLITPFVVELNCSFIKLEKILIVFLFFFKNSLKTHYREFVI